MRERIAETISFAVCALLLLLIPLIVAIIVASPFAVYHVILNGWAAGWEDLKESSRFIFYLWGLLVGAGLFWSIATHFWNRLSEKTSLTSLEK